MITRSEIHAHADMNAAAGDLRRAAIAAFVWALLFGLVSMYWAAGGTIGESTLSRSIQDMAERREPAFVATLWGTGIAKVLGGLVPMALAFGWWNGIPRRLLPVLCWAGGVLLLLYGLGDMARATLVMTGTLNVDSPVDRDIARWYLLLWGVRYGSQAESAFSLPPGTTGNLAHRPERRSWLAVKHNAAAPDPSGAVASKA